MQTKPQTTHRNGDLAEYTGKTQFLYGAGKLEWTYTAPGDFNIAESLKKAGVQS